MKKDLETDGPEEEVLDLTLRPRKFSEYIGQDKTKDALRVFVEAAKMRGEPLEHILFYGPPGLGKTTLAHVMACETGSSIKITSGPAIERAGDLVSILTSLEDSDIIFIDEIHRLGKVVEEILYPAMEDYAVDIVVGKGPAAKTLRVDLPKFTLIGATTRLSLLSSPMRDRFGIIHALEFYNEQEIEKILHRSSRILDIKIDDVGVAEIAKRSRKTPRIANRLLKRVRDFAMVYGDGVANSEVTGKALHDIGIDDFGLDATDRRYLSTLVSKFDGGPAGLETLSAATSIDRDSIEEVIEPYLMQIGFIKRTPKGRVATELGLRYPS